MSMYTTTLPYRRESKTEKCDLSGANTGTVPPARATAEPAKHCTSKGELANGKASPMDRGWIMEDSDGVTARRCAPNTVSVAARHTAIKHELETEHFLPRHIGHDAKAPTSPVASLWQTDMWDSVNGDDGGKDEDSSQSPSWSS